LAAPESLSDVPDSLSPVALSGAPEPLSDVLGEWL
jgi:hypothetical protein